MEHARLDEQCRLLEARNVALMDALFAAGTDPSRWLSVDMVPSMSSGAGTASVRDYILQARAEAQRPSSDADCQSDSDADDADDAGVRVEVAEDLARGPGGDVAGLQRRLSRLSVFGPLAAQHVQPAPPPRRDHTPARVRRASSIAVSSDS